MFVRNTWYVAAWADEVARGSILPRVLLDEAVILYRTQSGTPGALEDRCCHRAAPLSLGTVNGELVECGYHGLRFDQSGRCVHIPLQREIPPKARVKSYPIVERWRFLWIWMGDPALADPGLIPEHYCMDRPEWDVSRGDLFHVKGNYQLVSDNFLDASHVVYVHKSTLAQPEVVDFPIRMERTDRSVSMTRWMIDVPPSPFHSSLRQFPGNVDRWQIAHVTAPSHFSLDLGSAPTGTGAPEGRRVNAVTILSPNEITPETESACHVFYAHCRNFALDDMAMREKVRQDMLTAYREDWTMIEAQQRKIDADPEHPLLTLGQDSGVVALRRIIQQMIAQEEAGDAVPRDQRIRA